MTHTSFFFFVSLYRPSLFALLCTHTLLLWFFFFLNEPGEGLGEQDRTSWKDVSRRGMWFWGDPWWGGGSKEKQKQRGLIMHAQHVEAVVFGVTSSLPGFRYAFSEATEAAFQPPLPCRRAVCQRTHRVSFAETEQNEGAEWDDNAPASIEHVSQRNKNLAAGGFLKRDKPEARHRNLSQRNGLSPNWPFWGNKATNPLQRRTSQSTPDTQRPSCSSTLL